MVILGRRGAGKDLADEVDNGIASSSKFSNDLKFQSRVFVVCDAGRLIGNEAKDFTQEGKSLADEVAGGQYILYVRGYGRSTPGGRRVGGMGYGLRERS
jgi:hypothetical protein